MNLKRISKMPRQVGGNTAWTDSYFLASALMACAAFHHPTGYGAPLKQMVWWIPFAWFGWLQLRRRWIDTAPWKPAIYIMLADMASAFMRYGADVSALLRISSIELVGWIMVLILAAAARVLYARLMESVRQHRHVGRCLIQIVAIVIILYLAWRVAEYVLLYTAGIA